MAAIAGASSGYWAPWFAWKIEKARDRHSSRRAKVTLWKTELLDIKSLMEPNLPLPTMYNHFNIPSSQSLAPRIVSTISYLELRPHLSKSFNDYVKGLLATDGIMMGTDQHDLVPKIVGLLSEEIDRIEKLWDLS